MSIESGVKVAVPFREGMTEEEYKTLLAENLIRTSLSWAGTAKTLDAIAAVMREHGWELAKHLCPNGHCCTACTSKPESPAGRGFHPEDANAVIVNLQDPADA